MVVKWVLFDGKDKQRETALAQETLNTLAQNYQLPRVNMFSKFLPGTLFFALSNSVPIVIKMFESLKHILSYNKAIGFRF